MKEIQFSILYHVYMYLSVYVYQDQKGQRKAFVEIKKALLIQINTREARRAHSLLHQWMRCLANLGMPGMIKFYNLVLLCSSNIFQKFLFLLISDPFPLYLEHCFWAIKSILTSGGLHAACLPAFFNSFNSQGTKSCQYVCVSLLQPLQIQVMKTHCDV